MRYSKTLITKMITGVDGKERLYKAYKMPAQTTAIEGFKLLKAVMPSIGTGLDDMRNSDDTEEFNISTTWTAAFQLLQNNLTVEHFEDLQDKLMGSLMYVDTPIKEDHFDEFIGDYLEVLFWLFKENFSNFILQSGMLRSKIQNAKKMVQGNQKLSELIENVLKEADTDTKI